MYRTSANAAIARLFPLVASFLLAGNSVAGSLHHVTSNADDNSEGTLRYEVEHAADGDTVDFQLSDCPCEITLSQGEIDLNKYISIVGLGVDKLTISGNFTNRIFNVDSPGEEVGTTYISDMELRDGRSNDGGGAINISTTLYAEVELSDLLFRNNQSSYLGGAIVSSIGSVSITRSVFLENSNSDDFRGGAIFNSTNLYIDECSFSQNIAGQGGAIANDGNLLVRNTTFSDNTATGEGTVFPAEGGAIYMLDSTRDVATVESSTIVDNNANSGGGIFANGVLTLANTIVANNVAENASDISGQVVSLGHNLISNRSGSFGYNKTTCDPSLDHVPVDLTEQNPRLLKATMSHGFLVAMPLADSPVRNAISIRTGPSDTNSTCDGVDVPPTDERGVPRPVDSRADIGAIEYTPDDDRIFCTRVETVDCESLR